MADNSVNELLPLINRQIEVQEIIEQYALNIDALANIAVSDEKFLEYPRWIVHGYLCAIGDIILLLRKTAEDDIDFLLKVKKCLIH